MLGLTCWPNHHYVGNIFFQLCKNKKKGEGERKKEAGGRRGMVPGCLLFSRVPRRSQSTKSTWDLVEHQ